MSGFFCRSLGTAVVVWHVGPVPPTRKALVTDKTAHGDKVQVQLSRVHAWALGALWAGRACWSSWVLSATQEIPLEL